MDDSQDYLASGKLSNTQSSLWFNLRSKSSIEFRATFRAASNMLNVSSATYVMTHRSMH